MIDLQRMRVDEHIAGIEHDAAALHAERERDRRRDAQRDLTGAESVRIRVGRWLVAVGEALAGPAAPCDDDVLPNAA
jgi:hypothetical protein